MFLILVLVLLIPIIGINSLTEEKYFPVILSDGNTYNIYSKWYQSNDDNSIQVLVHGASYSHTYWDAKIDSVHEYSYANYMVSKNYNILAIDLIGAGLSDKPFDPNGLNGTTLGIEDTASSLAQIIDNLKKNGKYSKIILVGHSNGAIVSAYTQAKYKSADLLILNGKGYAPSPLVKFFNTKLGTYLLNSQYANPYLSNENSPRPFVYPLRPLLFYYPFQTELKMLFKDPSELGSTIAEGQMRFLTNLGMLSGEEQSSIIGTRDITIPVLIQFGQYDLVAPAYLATEEYKYWNDLTIQIIPSIGHVFNLHKNNKESWDKIDNFIHINKWDKH